MKDIMIGALIGSMWTAIVAFAAVAGLRGELGPVVVKRIMVDPETMEEWIGEKMWRATLSVISNLERITSKTDWTRAP